MLSEEQRASMLEQVSNNISDDTSSDILSVDATTGGSVQEIKVEDVKTESADPEAKESVTVEVETSEEVETETNDVRADVGLVLVVRRDDFDVEALLRGTEIFDRHARRDHRTFAGKVGIHARAVIEHAELDVDVLGEGAPRAQRAERRADSKLPDHCGSLPVVTAATAAGR